MEKSFKFVSEIVQISPNCDPRENFGGPQKNRDFTFTFYVAIMRKQKTKKIYSKKFLCS